MKNFLIHVHYLYFYAVHRVMCKKKKIIGSKKKDEALNNLFYFSICIEEQKKAEINIPIKENHPNDIS